MSKSSLSGKSVSVAAAVAMALGGAALSPTTALGQREPSPADVNQEALTYLRRAAEALGGAQRDLRALLAEIHAKESDEAAARALTAVNRTIADIQSGRPQRVKSVPEKTPGKPASSPPVEARTPSQPTPTAQTASTAANETGAPASNSGSTLAPAAGAGWSPAPAASSTGTSAEPRLSRNSNQANTMEASNHTNQASHTPTNKVESGASDAGISAAELQKLIGRTVVNRDDQILGTLKKVLTTPNGQIEKVVIAHGGFLGFFQDDSEIDWQSAKPRIEAGRLVLAITPNQVASAPQYSVRASE